MKAQQLGNPLGAHLATVAASVVSLPPRRPFPFQPESSLHASHVRHPIHPRFHPHPTLFKIAHEPSLIINGPRISKSISRVRFLGEFHFHFSRLWIWRGTLMGWVYPFSSFLKNSTGRDFEIFSVCV